MSDYLPLEVVQLVLWRLPIKPLLRCSTTCKAWYNLINSPQFIYAHLNFLKSRPDSTRLLIAYKRNRFRYEHLKWKYILYSDDKAGTFEELNRFEFPIESLRVVGCCNGLICLANNNFQTTCTPDEPKREVILWNPIIRKTLHLPKSKMQLRFDEAMDSYCSDSRRSPTTFGFVFDHIRNDYKVLRIYGNGWAEVPSMVEIFRLSTGLWEDISHKAAFFSICWASPHVDLKGISHWIGEDNNRKLKIITFDVCDEVFGTIDLPANVANDDDDEMYEQYSRNQENYLFAFEESLFFILGVTINRVFDEDDFYNTHLPDRRKFYVWKMEEYNVVESWNQVETFVVDVEMEPLGFRKNGEVLWAVTRGLLMSNNFDALLMSTNYFDDALSGNILGTLQNDSPMSCSYYCSRYVETLVLLDKTDEHHVEILQESVSV